MGEVWGDWIDGYCVALAAQGKAPGTIRLRRWQLWRLARGLPLPDQVTVQDLEWALSGDMAPETKRSLASALRGVYRWANKAGRTDYNPALGLDGVTVPPGMPRPTPEGILQAALEVAPPRERLMMLFAAYAGLRCCEIAKIHTSDWDGFTLRVVGKGSKVRVVPILHDELLLALGSGSGYLFPFRGEAMTAGHVSRLLSRCLPDGWTGHTLRHRMATRSYRAHPDPFALGKVLGHSRPETTLRYVLIGDEALVAAVRAAA